MMRLVFIIFFFLFPIVNNAQPFTHSGHVYGANGQGLNNIPVSLYTKRTSSYEVTFPNYPNSASYNTGTVVPSSDDVVHGPFNIGFTFNYFGVNYTKFYIGSNGWIGFSPGQTTGYTAAFIPNAGSPLNAILADWEDLFPGASNIYYSTSGFSPNRVLIVSFNAVPHYGCRSNLHTFQFVLYETTNVIEINYLSKPICGGNNATAGLISNTFTTVVPVGGKNASPWSVTNYSVRFTPASPDSVFTLRGIYYTNQNGQYSMVPNLDDASNDFEIRLESLNTQIPNLSGAKGPISILFDSIRPSTKLYYLLDVNRDGIFSVSDSYLIYGRISGSFSDWLFGYPKYRIFSPTQWNLINNGSQDMRNTVPGVQNMIIQNPTRGGVTNFHLLRTGVLE